MKKNTSSYNSITFGIFSVLIIGSFSYFSFADNTNLTLFDDFDRDGLSNGEEQTYGTDQTKADTDGDGYSDGVEVQSGYNPLIPAPGDRIVNNDVQKHIAVTKMPTDDVTRKIAANVVSHLADAQENGEAEMTAEEFTKVVSEATTAEMDYVNVPPVNLDEITVKKQDYDDLSKREQEERMKQDAVEYFTAISYIFVSNFPDGFFDRSPELFQTEFMQNVNNFSGSLTNFSYFESMAKNAVAAESQMTNVEVPEEMLEIHTEALYLLRYIKSIYEKGSYQNVTTDAAPMIASLAQIQSLLQHATGFQDKVTEKLEKYGIDTSLMQF